MQEEKKTTLACRYKQVPCPNRACRGHARYSIRNFVENREGEEREYDPFTSFSSDAQVRLSRSELVASCDSPKCGVNRANWNMPLLHSVCPDCKDITLMVRVMCGFHNFHGHSVTDYLTGVSKSGLDISTDMGELLVPAIPIYLKDSKVVFKDDEELVKFAIVSVCMKRAHTSFSFFSCPTKECCNPAVPQMRKDSVSYSCSRGDHPSFHIVAEPYPGAADIGSDPCRPQHSQIKCPQCLTAMPAVINNMEGDVSSKNWMVPSYICSNPKCKFMWKSD